MYILSKMYWFSNTANMSNLSWKRNYCSHFSSMLLGKCSFIGSVEMFYPPPFILFFNYLFKVTAAILCDWRHQCINKMCRNMYFDIWSSWHTTLPPLTGQIFNTIYDLCLITLSYIVFKINVYEKKKKELSFLSLYLKLSHSVKLQW
jgi:hypothetical protein